MERVVVIPARNDPEGAIGNIFDQCGGLEQLLGGRTKVWIKINAIDCRSESYTSPEVLEAAIKVLQSRGISDICVVENCTQGNFTRLVFTATGIGKVCRQLGVRPLFLDEEPTDELNLPGVGQKARFPRPVIKELIREKREVFFLNLPRLKTHCMTVVTLGIKNLFGLMDQRDRMVDHNDNLHKRLVALNHIFRPDFTIIDGIKAVYHGHYPPESVLDRCLAPLGILLGGANVTAVDTVGARILGYSADEVPHLKLAGEIYGDPTNLNSIYLVGDIDKFTKKYPYTLLPERPPDVKILRGIERCCPEGCRLNTEAVLQYLYLDHGGRGGFNIVMGKGFHIEDLNKISGPVFVAGKCAIEDTAFYFEKNNYRSKIYRSPACNDLASTVHALTRLMKVNPLKLVPLNPLHSLVLLVYARLKGSKARVAL